MDFAKLSNYCCIQEFENIELKFFSNFAYSWDTAGHDRFKCVANYYRNTNVIAVVFDMTRAESLMNARRWMDEVMRHNHPGTLKFLVGTKKDLLVGHLNVNI